MRGASLIGFATAVAAVSCGSPRTVGPCGEELAVAAYGDVLPPTTGGIWYEPEPYVPVDAPGSSSGDDGWDTPDVPDPGSSDGWDDPDPQALTTRSLRTGCFSCQLVCVGSGGAFTTVGASATSRADACRDAARRLVRAESVTSCADVDASAARRIGATTSMSDRIERVLATP